MLSSEEEQQNKINNDMKMKLALTSPAGLSEQCVLSPLSSQREVLAGSGRAGSRQAAHSPGWACGLGRAEAGHTGLCPLLEKRGAFPRAMARKSRGRR